jgi:GDSL-like Lipase/Acylhydrolase family
VRRFVRRLGLLLLWTAYCALLLEGGARAIFAWKAGPSALVYGTPLARAEIRREMRWDEMIAVEDKGTAELASEIGSYSKYHPGQYQSLSVEAPDKPATLLQPAGVAWYPVTANNHGFRGPDFDDAKAPGVARVITLGASSTYGYRNRNEETYPFYLQQHLNRALESRSCGDVRSFEVLNFGIPHLSSVNIHALFVAEGLALDPDVVTFYEGANETRRLQRKWYQRWLIGLSNYSVVALFLSTYWENQLETFTEADLRAQSEGKSDHFLKHVSGIADECKKHDVLFIVASQLARSVTLSRRYLADFTHAQEVELVENKLARGERLVMSEFLFLIHAEIMRSLEAWVKENDVPYVDIVRTFDEQRVRNQLLTWVHLTAKGNQLIAQELGDAILERFCTSQQASAGSP